LREWLRATAQRYSLVEFNELFSGNGLEGGEEASHKIASGEITDFEPMHDVVSITYSSFSWNYFIPQLSWCFWCCFLWLIWEIERKCWNIGNRIQLRKKFVKPLVWVSRPMMFWAYGSFHSQFLNSIWND
jgi:hypothetical protein